MWENQGFNTIIEEFNKNNEDLIKYKLIKLNLPKKNYIIQSNGLNFIYYGKTNFEKFYLDEKKSESSILRIKKNIIYNKGIILPFTGNISNKLKNPKAIITKLGKIFIHQQYMNDKTLIHKITNSNELIKLGEIFNNDFIQKNYSWFTSPYF